MSKELSRRASLTLFYILLAGCVVSSLMQTSMTTVLPAIMVSLHITASSGQWLTSIFTLAMGIMIPITPFLIKRFSTRKLIISALSIFSVGLLVSGIATNLPVMLIGRVLQALSSGIFVSLTQVAVMQIFPADKTGLYMGIYGLAVGGVPIFAPTLAGYISDSFGYRVIFFGVFGLSVLTLIWTLFSARNISEGVKAELDSKSVLLSVVGFGGLTLALDNLNTASTRSIAMITALVAVFALILFARRQLRIKNPLLNFKPFANRSFVIALIGSMLLYAVMMAGSLILPIYLQTLRGYSATTSGLITLPGSVIMMAFSPIAGRLFDRFGIKPVLVVVSNALLLSSLSLGFVNNTTSIWYILIAYMFRMLAVAMMMMPLVSWGLSVIDQSLTTHGSALISSFRTFSGAFCMVGMTDVLTHFAGGQATIKGVDLAFIGLSVLAAGLVAIALVQLFSKKRVK